MKIRRVFRLEIDIVIVYLSMKHINGLKVNRCTSKHAPNILSLLSPDLDLKRQKFH